MFKLTIEGKEIIPTTKKNYHGLCRGINIIEWLRLNGDDIPKAAIFFNYHEGSLRKKVYKLGYNTGRKKLITRDILERGILEHLDTGSIKAVVEDSGFHRMAISTGMRRLGYSLKKRCYVDKPASMSKVSWKDILYNKILSYKPETATA